MPEYIPVDEDKPEAPEPAIGKIAVCSIGYIGVITGQKELPWGLAWIGHNPFNGHQWSSRNPVILNDDTAEWISRGITAMRCDQDHEWNIWDGKEDE